MSMHNYTLPNLICGLRILYAFFLERQFKRAILTGRYNLQLPAEQRSQWQGIPYNQLTGAHAHQLKIIFRIRKILETSFRTGYGACQLPPSPQNSADLNRQNLSFILRSTSSSNKPRTFLSPPLSTHTHTHIWVLIYSPSLKGKEPIQSALSVLEFSIAFLLTHSNANVTYFLLESRLRPLCI